MVETVVMMIVKVVSIPLLLQCRWKGWMGFQDFDVKKSFRDLK